MLREESGVARSGMIGGAAVVGSHVESRSSLSGFSLKGRQSTFSERGTFAFESPGLFTAAVGVRDAAARSGEVDGQAVRIREEIMIIVHDNFSTVSQREEQVSGLYTRQTT